MSNHKKRVVITGIGPITPVGVGKEAYWESLSRGKTSFRKISFPDRDMSQYRCHIGAPIDGFDLSHFVERSKLSKHLGRTSQYAIAGAWLALKDSGIELDKNDFEKEGLHHKHTGVYHPKELDPFQIGVVLGVGVEAMDLLEHFHERFLSKGPKGISPFALPNIYLSAITSHVAQYFSIRGTSYAVSTACASATHAMINSFLQIQGGGEDLMVTGGADACITPYVFGGFDVLRAMSTRNDDPNKACRPFDRERDGFVMGEGAGVLVLEELEHAKKRGVHIYGEVVGFGMTADAFHLTDPDPNGKSLGKAVKDALNMADINPEEIDYINPHGTSTLLNDRVETRMIKDVFGKQAYNIPISSTKSITGHLLGAAGGAEAIAVLLAIEKGIIHPTLNYEFPDPECDLDYVPNQARQKEVRLGLSISAGFGGVNSAILIKKFEE
ncbi:MAG TPA: beta-ketoacyl-[acyl-carrier-protein] synthase family protein [Thermodesulfobacteriota bacterium]|nr:beta-ketoacyl-[acyl-carrier-protein] synthase family protein [Thermodesulfobacteriota bacterium]